MAAHADTPQIIGRVEKLDFPELGAAGVHGRIDTGAQTSAIWASRIHEEDGRLRVIFFGAGSPHFTGQAHYFDDFTQAVVASSNGQTEQRYKVRLLVVLNGRKIRANFSLADRSTQVYPVLIGRNVLKGKFVVDVKRGDVLEDAERQRSKALQQSLDNGESEGDK